VRTRADPAASARECAADDGLRAVREFIFKVLAKLEGKR
jgi:hypothetical protein